MPDLNRRRAIGLALGGAVTLLGLPATAQAVQAAGTTTPWPPPLPVSVAPGDCLTFSFKGRKITLCPGEVLKHGLSEKAIMIDERPIPIMTHGGKFFSPLNQHVTFDTPLDVALDAVRRLENAELLPDRPPLKPPPGLQLPRPGGYRKAQDEPVRKNVAALTAAERASFVRAVLSVKESGVYDYFVDVHMRAFTNTSWAAHMSAGILPWHRAFLYLMEVQLINAGASALPYWDWSTQRAAGRPPFTGDLMGGDGYFGSDAGQSGRPRRSEVTTGPFAFSRGDWPITVANDSRDYLRRELGQRMSAPSGPDDVRQTMGLGRYDEAPYDRTVRSFRNLLEGWWSSGSRMHNSAHVWVGGNMGPSSSPNDPVFFLNHAYVDKLWADWQGANPDVPHYEPSNPANGAPGLDTPLEPFNSDIGWRVTPRDTTRFHNWYVYDSPA